MDASSPLRLAVLVVGRATPSRNVLAETIEAIGHDVCAKQPGDEVRTHLTQRDVDVIVLEYAGDGGDELVVARELPGLPVDRWLPVIAVRTSASGNAAGAMLPSDTDDELQAPVAPALLAARLAKFGALLARQARLAALEQHHRHVLDNILDPVLTLDQEERIVDANLAARQTFGQGLASELIGCSIEDVTGQTLQALVTPGLAELRQSDGVHYPAEVSASVWRENTAPRTTLVLRNFVERLRMERMRDEFLATVSHELRTPLTSVLGAVGLLASGAFGTLTQPATTLVGVAQRNGERLSKLIDDILDLTKLEGDRMVMSLRAQALAPLIREAVTANQGYANRAGVTLRYVFSDEVTSSRPLVRVDADRFLQIMANLLSNAIKHSPSQETVEVRVRTEGSGCTVNVIDQGPGIDPAFRERLFEKFSQADTSDRRALSGTGLGLYIARLMAERMGGTLEAASGVTKGATFELWLPSAHAESQTTAGLAPQRHSGDA
jgi:signal transduction histidine kinase